jgi:hypothetical protein
VIALRTICNRSIGSIAVCVLIATSAASQTIGPDRRREKPLFVERIVHQILISKDLHYDPVLCRQGAIPHFRLLNVPSTGEVKFVTARWRTRPLAAPKELQSTNHCGDIEFEGTKVLLDIEALNAEVDFSFEFSFDNGDRHCRAGGQPS